MADSTLRRLDSDIQVTAAAAISAGEIWQMADGRGAGLKGYAGAASGDRAAFEPKHQHTVTKTSGIVFLDGGRVYWDHSANAAHYKKVNDRDFYLGRAVGDAASGDTTLLVNFNIPEFEGYTIDLLRDGALSVATGTSAAGGFGIPALYGGKPGLRLTATSEAQCIDMFSVDRVAVAANPIAEFIFRLGANGSTSDVDINLGVANATSTTDADGIVESVFIHIDGGSLDIKAESDDGTTEVAATDTTIDATAGSAVSDRIEVWMDMRDPADIQIYINGVLVLGSTVFTLAAATGPIGLLAHLEKTTGTATAGPVYIDHAKIRTAQQ